jgi:hypothetical protein
MRRCMTKPWTQIVKRGDTHMYRISKAVTSSIVVLILSFLTIGIPAKTNKDSLKRAATKNAAVLWRDPGDIASRNLFYGPGGKDHEPRGTFTFEREDMTGSNPKFDVVDQDGVKWRVKMGPEARPETVASRLVWGVGYFANEDFFMPSLHVQKMQRLRRGQHLVSPDGTVHNVRLKRHLKDEKKIGSWSWAKSPFTNTREWYGLRVLMAVMNNWDLKDNNNSVYLTRDEPPEERYLVSDLGASFGTTGLNWMLKGNPTAYCDSKWIKAISPQFVDFNVPSPPAMNYYIDFPELGRRLSLLWLGRHIPRTDARWMGDLLARLSPDQIRDAFRAAGYSSQEIEQLSKVVQRRIAELEKL